MVPKREEMKQNSYGVRQGNGDDDDKGWGDGVRDHNGEGLEDGYGYSWGVWYGNPCGNGIGRGNGNADKHGNGFGYGIKIGRNETE